MANDILKTITLSPDEVELVLTAHFNGGPIVISLREDKVTKSHTFAADPFLRKRDHNIAIANLLFEIPSGTVDPPLFLVAQFANMFSNADQPTSGVKWHIELSDARGPSSLYSDGGTLAFEKNANVVILIQR